MYAKVFFQLNLSFSLGLYTKLHKSSLYLEPSKLRETLKFFLSSIANTWNNIYSNSFTV